MSSGSSSGGGSHHGSGGSHGVKTTSSYLVQVRAQVMMIDDSTGLWIPRVGGGLSDVAVLKRLTRPHHHHHHSYQQHHHSGSSSSNASSINTNNVTATPAVTSSSTNNPHHPPLQLPPSNVHHHKQHHHHHHPSSHTHHHPLHHHHRHHQQQQQQQAMSSSSPAQAPPPASHQQQQPHYLHNIEGPTKDYLIYGRKVSDQSVVLSCTIRKDFEYNKVMPTFHHWRTGDHKFGLTFQTAADARAFDKGVRQAVKELMDGEHFQVLFILKYILYYSYYRQMLGMYYSLFL